MLALLAETLGPEEICGVIHISLSPICSDGTIIISALTQPNRAGSQPLREGLGAGRAPWVAGSSLATDSSRLDKKHS